MNLCLFRVVAGTHKYSRVLSTECWQLEYVRVRVRSDKELHTCTKDDPPPPPPPPHHHPFRTAQFFILSCVIHMRDMTLFWGYVLRSVKQQTNELFAFIRKFEFHVLKFHILMPHL